MMKKNKLGKDRWTDAGRSTAVENTPISENISPSEKMGRNRLDREHAVLQPNQLNDLANTIELEEAVPY